MKVLVRQIATGLYWKSGTGWVQAEEAEVFKDSSLAVLYCVREEMRDVHVILSFGDVRYDVVLSPFGRNGNEPTNGELREQTGALTKKMQEVSEKTKALLAAVNETVAQAKERRKKRPFKRKRIAGEELE